MAFISSIAKRSVFAYIPILLVGLLAAVLGATQPFGLPDGDAVILVFVLFLVPILLSISLKSFRKAVIGTLPIFLAILWTVGTVNLLGISLEGATGLFAAIVLGFGATDNLIIMMDYFRSRSQPMTVASAIESAFERNEKGLIAGSIVAIITFLSLSLSSSPALANIGVVSGLAIAYVLIANVVVLPALTNLFEFTSAKRAITPKESKILHYIRSYGKEKDSHPFYASWLGIAIEEIEDAIENLEAKGFFGPYFFSLEDPLVWFLLLFSFLFGASIDNLSLPPLSLLQEPGIALLLLTTGLCIQGPQMKKRLDRKLKKVMGLVLILSGGYFAYAQSMGFLEGYLILLVVGLLSIYLAGTKLFILSNLASAVYFGVVFSLSWSHFGVLALTDNIYAVAFALLVFVLILGIEEETYVKIESL